MVVLALGGSDCEALRDGLLGQPVNGLSSLAYVVGGAIVWWRRGPSVPALALATVGVGSGLYHGPMPAGAELVHDASLVALGAAIAVGWWRGALPRPPARTLVTFGVALVANALTRTDAVWCRPDSLLQGHALWHLLTALAATWWFLAPAPPASDPSRKLVVLSARAGRRSQGRRTKA